MKQKIKCNKSNSNEIIIKYRKIIKHKTQLDYTHTHMHSYFDRLVATNITASNVSYSGKKFYRHWTGLKVKAEEIIFKCICECLCMCVKECHNKHNGS